MVAATSAAGTSSVNTTSGSSFSTAARNIGSAVSAGLAVRTTSAMVRPGCAGRCRYGRGSSPTERTLWSRTTPMISVAGSSKVPVWNRSPTGLRPGQYLRASVSFTIATLRWPATSSSLNARPWTIGIPTAWK